MFNDFLAHGNLVSVLLMLYASGTMVEVLRIDRADPYSLYSPRILKHPLSSILMFLAAPCAFWPAIYIGLYEGWLAGIAAWFVLQISTAIGSKVLGIRHLLTFHFIAACIAYPAGYYLSITNLP